MVRANVIETAILELDGGAYHNLMDEYFHEKFKCTNI